MITLTITGLAAHAASVDVLTQHNDVSRSGAQLYETTLTPSNVTPTTFGRLYERQVDAQIIAQPLYVSNLAIAGKGTYNVVFVATRNNTVYAFDADNLDPNPTHGLIWSQPVTVEPAAPPPGMCTETIGPVGITSTPVIDRTNNAMYLVARRSDGTIWLNVLD
ncbi:MAG TPA: PQQ-binding-like beta-propeller repeat protein, partial [Methylocella sp.]|nr:PQQ-binding-like beta-propeller repeat protein [Methylocella sp.]